MLDREQGAIVRQLIDSLPALFRETLILRELNELSYREIAEVTCVPVGTVMSRLARARALLAWKARDGFPQPQNESDSARAQSAFESCC